jgi:hypothetical protein
MSLNDDETRAGGNPSGFDELRNVLQTSPSSYHRTWETLGQSLSSRSTLDGSSTNMGSIASYIQLSYLDGGNATAQDSESPAIRST